MDVQQIRKEKQKLEENIFKLVEGFKAKTEISPHKINIEFLDISELGSPQSVFMVGRVSIDIKI